MKINVGISACVLGENVRFDSGHKKSNFVVKELGKYVEFVPVCPEVGIGLGVPRPTIRLMENEIGIRLVETKDADKDYTDRMHDFAAKKVGSLQSQDLRGYIVCAKSPTCGMERVKVYRENGYVAAEKIGIGLFTQKLMEEMPWLPVEEDGRLNDPILRENFVTRIFALDDFYRSMEGEPTKDKIIKFHSRYKYALLAHSQDEYRALGRFVADIASYDINEFFSLYRLKLMNVLKKRATRKNNTNVLMHLQGYFKKNLSKEQKADLSEVILSYNEGTLPLMAPITLINHHLREFPDDYLSHQAFLSPYPKELKVRYGL